MTRARDNDVRWGIAELFGRQVDRISLDERRRLLQHSISRFIRDYPECPFRLPAQDGNRRCNKAGGVCSLRRYKNNNGLAERISGTEGMLTVTCPERFHQDSDVFYWVGKTLLDVTDPEQLVLTKEVPFLETVTSPPADDTDEDTQDGDEVGRIDLILVNRSTIGSNYLRWCALEIQAVYFSGAGMSSQFQAILDHEAVSLPFPDATRRPDYRSSAPKRLMPQLQTKIPALRRWGKKMAVVVDRHFFDWIGTMDAIPHISNADILWFVCEFDDGEDRVQSQIRRSRIASTTLERAIDGLTGGVPVALETFEQRILENIQGGNQRGRSKPRKNKRR